jgi:hypothetical protein
MYARLLWEAPPAALRPVAARAPAADCTGCVVAPGLGCSSGDQQHVYVCAGGRWEGRLPVERSHGAAVDADNLAPPACARPP